MVPGPGAQTGSSPFCESRTSIEGKMVSCATQGDFLVVCVEGCDNQEEYGASCLFEEEVNRQVSSVCSHNTDSWF